MDQERASLWERRRETLLVTYGGEEGLRRHFQDMQRKSMLHPNKQKGHHKGGFSYGDTASKAGKIGGQISRKTKI